MISITSVLGVLGMCWVCVGLDVCYPTQILTLYFAALQVLCRVCRVWLRVRAWVGVFECWMRIFFHARADKPNTPCIPLSVCLKVLNFKAFICVG